MAAIQLRSLPVAIECLQRATMLAASHAGYWAQLARALGLAQMQGETIAAADKAMSLSLSSDDAAILGVAGMAYSRVNAHDKAADCFRRLAALMPDYANAHFNLATSLVTFGKITEALAEMERCVELDPRHWQAHLAIAHLRKQTPESNHVDRLTALQGEAAGDWRAMTYLDLALSKEEEDLGQFGASFEHLSRAKSLAAEALDYSIERDEAMFNALRSGMPVQVPESEGSPSAEPIFVFGMPRSGTTLVEKIISGHPDVQSAGELQNFLIALKNETQSQSPALLDAGMLAAMRDIDWRRLGETYVASTRPITGRLPRFVDKWPHNFLFAGLIANALPRASLICVRRDPMDVCLSNFRQLFSLDGSYYDYSFDLLDTGRYYIQFERLMAFWKERLGDRFLELRYESLVEHQEQETRKLLAFCGLPWHEDCLRFQDNPSAAATASAAQVRSPLNRSSIGRWKKYEKQLQPLKALLAGAGIDVDQ